MEQVDITIIGAGVVGLSVAAELSGDGKEIIVVERHDSFGREGSSRNSEVIHTGIYYPQNSLKARFCLEGRNKLYEMCSRHDIPFRKLGKLIVVPADNQLTVLEGLKQRGEINGVERLSLLDRQQVNKREPHIRAAAGLWSPETGIIDSHRLMAYLEKRATSGTTFAYNCELISLEKGGGEYMVGIRDADGDTYRFKSRVVVNSAGLGAEEVAKMAGIDTEKAGYTIYPCKGEYFRVGGRKANLLNHLVYPPPTDISVGLHTVIDLQGGLKLGPNAFFVHEIDYKVEEDHREEFYRSVKDFLPFIEEEDLSPDMAGIRPKLYRKGEPERDFVIRHEEDRGLTGLINLIGIESPGLTAAPAICKCVAGMVNEIL